MKLFDDTPEQETLLDLWLPFTPKPKERPQFNRATGNAYTPNETRKAEREAVKALKEHLPSGWKAYADEVEVRWEFDRHQLHFVMLTAQPYTARSLRGDTDNYMKLVSDAFNGVAYIDDRQIVSTTGRKL